MSEKLNLYQKIVEIRRAVDYIKKDNQGHAYKYVKEGDILAKIRPVMDKIGVVLEVDISELITTTDAIRMSLKFVWVDADNPSDRIEKNITMCDYGKVDVKKCGSLMTYGTKYFLFKFLNIETGDDDPDDVQEPMMSKEQVAELTKLYREKGTEELYKSHLKGYGVEHLKEIPAKEFAVIFHRLHKYAEAYPKEKK